MSVGRRFEDDVLISGIGQSDVGRRVGRSALALTIAAIDAAVSDAGLSFADIGGITTYPGDGTSIGPGFAGPSIAEVQGTLGIELDFTMGGFEGPAQLGPLVAGSLAISAGLVRHVVVYRTVTEGSARRAAKEGIDPEREPSRAGEGPEQWVVPFGSGLGVQRYARLARRHFDEYGTTREQLAQIALTARAHARLNPRALYRDELTLADYLAARMIADPLCLYDCDPHCDGSTAILLSHADYATDAKARVVRIDALGVAPLLGEQRANRLELQPGRRAGEQMWNRTDLRPADVDVAGLYDGFSILTMLWLEALGFCGRGESGSFVERGERISLGGDLPINTNGGQLSGGRLHGMGFVHEMCLQLRGEAGARQVPQARVAAVAVGGQPGVGCMLLRGPDS